jgi:hypothetical protein
MSAAMIMVLWKGGLAFGLQIAFASWELYQLRKMRLEGEAKARAAAAEARRPAPAQAVEPGERARVKVLEPV